MKKIITIIISLILLPFAFARAESIGDSRPFYIQSSYDFLKRNQVQAVLKKVSSNAYWYVDSDWLDGLDESQLAQAENSLDFLSDEFDGRIYPMLTQILGNEWNPGIDNDSKISVLMHPMAQDAGGYFNSADEFPKTKIPESNEREMVYFNVNYLSSALAKNFLAHEFQHLISYNQKEKNYGLNEEVWLNEARSEYVSTILGYNDVFEGSNLEKKLNSFLDKPYDSLTEWKNLSYDYGVVNMFINYLVDHYGLGILTNSLRSQYVGIKSINYALAKASFAKDFSQIFTDWTITVLVNDCEFSSVYCYLDDNLKSFKLAPSINYLPAIGASTLSVTNTTKDWSGNWHKFIGGNSGNLKLEFMASASVAFKIPYLIQDADGNTSLFFLNLDGEGKGEIDIPGFGSDNVSLIIIPSAQNKISNFSDSEQSISFFWSASTAKEQGNESFSMQQLLAQISELKKEVARLQALLGQSRQAACSSLSQNLYYGMTDNDSVKCLQEFLKSQGSDVYPEGLVTGNFLSLTKEAVVRFQEKYASEILYPLNLQKGTGFVGLMTRNKINQLFPVFSFSERSAF